MAPRLPERRRDVRVDVTRPAKVRCGVTGRYYPAQVCNLSAGGALLVLSPRATLAGGQRIGVGIAQHNRHALLSAADMADARVIRSLAHDGAQHVAIEFAQRIQLVAA